MARPPMARDEVPGEPPRWRAGVSAFVVGAVVLGLALVLYAWQDQRQYLHEPLHATVEAVGGCIAIGMAVVLIARWLEDGPAHFRWMATSLVAMGMLDLAHACMSTSPGFFWSRALPTVVGGLLMALVWLPPSGGARRLLWLQPPLVAVVLTLPLCVLLVAAPQAWPNPFDARGGYHAWAKALNLVGGLGFAAAAAFFLRPSQIARHLEANLAFGNHCVLFAIASFLFGLSFIWGPVWWLFHGMRLVAYVVVLKYIVVAYRRTHALTEAARQLEFERRLIGIVSHDLRNPLQAMQLAAETTLAQELPEKARRTLTRLSGTADRMNRMLTDLLDYSRARAAGEFTIDVAELDFARLAGQVRDEVATAHPAATIACETQGECTGHGDADRIHQVLVNLVENAVKHGDKAQPIHIRTVRDGEVVRIDVENGGRPIAPALLPTIFEPFQSGTRGASRRSFGLGLYIAREIVRAHGGDVTVESDEHRTRFRVVLPRTPRAAAA